MIPRVSCHHGDSRDQNNLVSARRILHENPEIDIMEIDFVFYNNDLVSSHDYSAHGILHGSSLREWIEMVILRHKKILWIDMKPDLSIGSFLWPSVKEEVSCLFTILRSFKRDIDNSLIITSQDPAITEEIAGNTPVDIKWRQTAADIPNLSSYFWQFILSPGLQGWNDDSVYKYFANEYDFSPYSIVAIDKSFFGHNIDRVIRFITESNIGQGTTVILYNFKKGAPVIRSEYCNIVMQYDYSSSLK